MVVRGRGWLVAGSGLLGFLLVVALVEAPQADPGTTVPERARLADLIKREQSRTETLREETATYRQAIDNIQSGVPEVGDVSARIPEARRRAGLTEVVGPGLVVTLTDSSFEESPTGNRNDLLIHSGDVHAVVNGLWEAGARAISINGERVVATSALLCVGNTLLINGTVHSPPYEFTAIGPAEEMLGRFRGDPLVERFGRDAETFELGFSVDVADELVVPAFEGPTSLRHAEPR